MTAWTLDFPNQEAIELGLRERRQRQAYTRGLAIVDDYANEYDEARAGRELFEYGIAEFAPFEECVHDAGELGESLLEGARVSSMLRPRGQSNRSLNEISLNSHLSLSLRERVLDLFGLAMVGPVGREYDPVHLQLQALSRDAIRMLGSGFPAELVTSALEVDERTLELALSTEPGPTTLNIDLPFYDERTPFAYSHTNSKGVTYYLHATEVTLRGGQPQTIYFFAKVAFNRQGQPVALPDDRAVKENPRNGFLTVSKRK